MLSRLMAQRQISPKVEPETTKDKFAIACKQVESDPNYRVSITNAELLNLIVSETKAWKSMSAVIVVKSEIVGPGNPSRIYEIKTAEWEKHKPVVKPQSTVLLVNSAGEYSFYNHCSALQGNFNHPLKHLNVSHYLQDVEILTPAKTLRDFRA